MTHFNFLSQSHSHSHHHPSFKLQTVLASNLKSSMRKAMRTRSSLIKKTCPTNVTWSWILTRTNTPFLNSNPSLLPYSHVKCSQSFDSFSLCVHMAPPLSLRPITIKQLQNTTKDNFNTSWKWESVKLGHVRVTVNNTLIHSSLQ